MKSRNAEKNMLTRLRKGNQVLFLGGGSYNLTIVCIECGLAYTSQLEGMLRDIKHSHDLMNEFKVINIYKRDFTFSLNEFMLLVITRRSSHAIQFQSEYIDIWILAILYTFGNQPST